MPATRHDIPPEFLNAADDFVQLANHLTDRYSRKWVAATMMYATARFNGFAGLTHEAQPDQTPDQAAAHYASEYDNMLRDNLDELAPTYRGATPQTS
jgi:hypothetical protein